MTQIWRNREIALWRIARLVRRSGRQNPLEKQRGELGCSESDGLDIQITPSEGAWLSVFLCGEFGSVVIAALESNSEYRSRNHQSGTAKPPILQRRISPDQSTKIAGMRSRTVDADETL